MFRLNIFPADDGDCLLLDYGSSEPYRHVLIDGGRRSAYTRLRPELVRLATRGERIDLLILTHIDADHIEGLLDFVKDPQRPIEVAEVWYNSFQHLSSLEAFGPKQGDEFASLIPKANWNWNTRFGGGSVVVSQSTPTIELAGGLVLTLLSPTADALSQLRAVWAKWRASQQGLSRGAQLDQTPEGLETFGRRTLRLPLDVEALAAAPTEEDSEPPNGSSIALVAEFEGKRVILAGDAHPSILESSIRSLGKGSRYKCDLYKVSHHGSRANTTSTLVGELDCHRFVISTSGARHGHPDPEAIARLLKFAPTGPKTLYFNYVTDKTAPWGNPELERQYDYRCVFASQGDAFSTVDI